MDSAVRLKQVEGGSTLIALVQNARAVAVPSGDATSSVVTLANATNWPAVSVVSGLYEIRFVGTVRAAATTTGGAIALSVTGGGTVTITGQNVAAISSTSIGGTEQISNANTTGATSGVRAAATNTPFASTWLLRVTANATINLMLRSEVAASNFTINQHSALIVERLGA